ncbi:MAG: hypothetical protein ACYCSN_00065 [Acidobacteriaceae bacterium]
MEIAEVEGLHAIFAFILVERKQANVLILIVQGQPQSGGTISQ